MSETVLAIRGLGKRYRLGRVETGFERLRRRIRGGGGTEHMWALRDVTFDVPNGQALGIIGRNGAGKSTLLKILARVTEPTEGYADIAGRLSALLEVGTGFSGELTGRENVYLNGSILGMTRREIDRKLEQIVEFAGVEKHIDTPVKWYSSGMYVRLAFAVAAHLEPEILVIDEVLAVGDAEFQKKCLQRMTDVVDEGRTILFVSHNLQILRRLCPRAVLLEEGRLVADGETDGVIQRYLSSIDLDSSGVRSWRDEPLGDEACRFLELRVSDPDGQPGSTFFTSKPISVTLEFEVDDLNPVLNIGFELATADGVVVFGTYFRDAPDQQGLRLRTGLNALRCEIPAALLNSGRYMINLHASVHQVRWIVHADAVLHFDVILDHGDSLFLSTAARPGVIAPQVAWEQVEPAASPLAQLATP